MPPQPFSNGLLAGLDNQRLILRLTSEFSHLPITHHLIPARLSLDLVQVGIACQGVQPFWGEAYGATIWVRKSVNQDENKRPQRDR